MQDRGQKSEGFVFRSNPDQTGGQELATTDRGVLGVRLLQSGEATDLEEHPSADTITFVKRGKARFVGPDGAVLAESSDNDVVLFPAGTSYRIEALSDGELELIQFYASSEALSNEFVPFA